MLFTGLSHAQAELKIQGVIEDDLGDPVIGAHVLLKDVAPMTGATSDINGFFELPVRDTGLYQIQVSYTGFETYEGAVKVEAGRIASLQIMLQITTLDEVVVVAGKDDEPYNRLATLSARRIELETAERYPGGFNDVGRMAQNFAGVQKKSSNTNELLVRGNAPGTVLWRVEGVDIPNPNHFAEFGNSGGPLSVLNTNTFEGADFFTGAFAAEYSNALGAVFDIRLRGGQPDRYRLSAQFGFNGLEIMGEGPVIPGKKASFMLNYRHSNLTLLEKTGLIDFDVHLGAPTFHDMTFKFDIPTKEIGHFSVFGITGKSNFDQRATRILNKPNASEEARQEAIDEGSDNLFGSLTGVYGISHRYLLGEKSYTEARIAFSRTRAYFYRDTLDQQLRVHPQMERNFTQDRISSTFTYNRYIGKRHLVKAGITFSNLFFRMHQDVFQPATGDFEPLVNSSGATQLLQSFATWQYRSSNDFLVLNLGVHHQHFFLNHSSSTEPRAGAQFHLNERHRLSAAVGFHGQLLPTPDYFLEDGENRDNPPPNLGMDMMKSIHYVMGHRWAINDRLTLTTEVFYQDLFDVPVSAEGPSSWSLINEGAYEFEANKPLRMTNAGLAQNYGLDLTLELSEWQGFYGLLTNSLFRSRFRGSDEIWRRTAWDAIYVTNLIAGKRLTFGKHLLDFTMRANLSGGKRFAPIQEAESIEAGQVVRDFSRDFTEQYPAFFKMDFRIGYTLPARKVRHEFAMELQNITNRQNVRYQTYSRAANGVKTIYELGFYPVFQYRIRF